MSIQNRNLTHIFFYLILSVVAQASTVDSFREAIATFSAHSVDRQVQLNRLSAVRVSENAKGLYWTPNNLELSVSHQIPGSHYLSPEGSGVALSFDLWNFGGDLSAYRAAHSRTQVEEERTKTTANEVENAASELLFSLLRQRRIVEIQKAQVVLKEESLQVAEQRYQQGFFPEQDLDKIRLETESARMANRQADLERIRIQILVESSVDNESRSKVLAINTWPYIGVLNRVNTAGLQPAKSRPEVLVPQFEAQSHRFESSSMWRSGYLPRLSLTAGWSRADLGPLQSGEWNAYLTLSIPLWDQLGASARSQSEDLLALDAETQGSQILRKVESEEKHADENLKLHIEGLQAAMRSVEKLKSIRSDSLRRFRLGRSSVNDLLLDERRGLDAETALEDSQLAYHIFLVKLCHAKGESLQTCY